MICASSGLIYDVIWAYFQAKSVKFEQLLSSLNNCFRVVTRAEIHAWWLDHSSDRSNIIKMLYFRLFISMYSNVLMHSCIRWALSSKWIKRPGNLHSGSEPSHSFRCTEFSIQFQSEDCLDRNTPVRFQFIS